MRDYPQEEELGARCLPLQVQMFADDQIVLGARIVGSEGRREEQRAEAMLRGGLVGVGGKRLS